MKTEQDQRLRKHNPFDGVRFGAFACAVVALGSASVNPVHASEPVASQSVTISQGIPNRNTRILPGEILITGDMLSVDAASGEIKIRTKSFQTSSGGIATVVKEKKVIVDANSRIYRYGAPDALISLSAIPANYTSKEVQFIGSNLASNELKVREVILPKDGNEISPSQPKDAKSEINAASLTLPALDPQPNKPLLAAPPKHLTAYETLENDAKAQFVKCGEGIGIPPQELSNATIEDHDTFLIAKNDKWLYCVDLRGNQTFRPTLNEPHFKSLVGSPPTSVLPKDQDTQELVPLTRDIMANFEIDTRLFTKSVLRREILVLDKSKGDKKDYYSGRAFIRLSDEYGNHYFQVIFGPDLKPIRFDTISPSSDSLMKSISNRLLTRATTSVSDARLVPIGSETSSVPKPQDKFVFGMFFDPDGYRFKVTARSYEGEDFLQIPKGDNFGRDNFNLSNRDFVDPNVYLQSKDYRHWSFVWWDLYGRVGGLKGNWHSDTQSWDRQNIIVNSYKLDNYSLVDKRELPIKDYPLSDKRKYPFPFATSQTLSPSFYQDLESCNAAFFFTHGGTINDRFQLRRGLDVWFEPGNEDFKFGRGNLRHLFFQGCDGMSVFNSNGKGLSQEWLPAEYVDGVRTVCGLDGASIGLDRGGWRFCGYFNKGESISDAWTFSLIDECDQNLPVTVAYGATRDEALRTLLDGSFSVDKADPTWVAASVWKEVK